MRKCAWADAKEEKEERVRDDAISFATRSLD